MAGSATIGALRVFLGIDTASFANGLKGAQGQLSRFGAMAAKATAAAAVAFTAAAGVLAVAFKGAVNEAESLGAMAQQIGIPVDELSRLKHAAELSELSLEGLSTGVRRLSKSMGDVARGAGKDVKVSFDALGISVTNADGSLRSSSDVISDVADRFSRMEDGATKTALAIAIFGRSGAQMIPMLNAGRDGLQAMKDEADRLGIVIDQNTAAAADRFNDNLSRLARVKDGIIMRMTQGMLPAFERLSQLLVDSAMKTNVFQSIGATLGRVMESLARAVMFVADNIGILTRIAAAFIGLRIAATVVSMGIAFVKLAGAIRVVGLVSAALTTILRAKQRAMLLVAAAIAMAAGQIDGFTAKMKQIGAAVEGMLPEGVSGQMTEWLGSLGFKVDALTREFEGLNVETVDTSGTLNQLEIDLGGAAAGAKAAGDAVKQTAADLAALNQEAEQVFMSTRTPLEGYGMEVQRLNLMFESGAIGFDTYGRALKQSRDGLSEFGGVAQSVGQSMQSSFTSAFDQMLAGTFKLQDAVRGLLQDLAKMVLNKALQTLLGGFSFGGGGGKGFGIGGIGHAANGADWRVGGSGGIDSKLIAFRATPGELVDVRKPGDDQGGAGGGIAGVVVNNYGQERARTAQRPDGMIEVIVGEIDRRMSEGRMGKGFAARHGLRPQRAALG